MTAKLTKILIKTAVFLALLSLCTGLLMPKYVESLEEGSFIAEYYREEVPHDVLFAGDCEAYGNFSPAAIWQRSGISSFVRGSAQQLIPQTYWLAAEMLEKETPKLLVVNVLAMTEPGQTNEAYNRMTVDGMRLSKYKIGAALASMTEEESLSSYLIPLLRFHSRWSELSSEDFRYLFGKPLVSHSGYLLETGVKPAENVPKGRPLGDYSFSGKNLEYLGRIADLCEEKGVRLLLVKAPTVYPYWYPQWDENVKSFAAERGVDYINLLELSDEIGLDMMTDTYDAGLHLNVSGAEKLSFWFADMLKERYGLEGHAGDPAYEAAWAEKLGRYEAAKAAGYAAQGAAEAAPAVKGAAEAAPSQPAGGKI